MAYQSLYRFYRPKSFDEVVGQQHVIKTLKNAIKRNQLAHAYLFTGPRGTGKTTIAKLLARGVNCQHPEMAPCNQCEHCLSMMSDNNPDIIEIDAASNNSVDDVRDLIERVKYAPIAAKYKVYIIDEVHMLSTGAFNALLKTLEEPPEHVIFVLATTDIQKVLPTIISRCQRYDFSPVSLSDIHKRLTDVFEEEKIEIEPEAIEVISKLADGGMRDALTISEQVIAYSDFPVKVQDIYDVYKICTPQETAAFIQSILNSDLRAALDQLSELESKSIDSKQFVLDVIDLCKQTMIYSISNTIENIQPRFVDSVLSLSKNNQNNRLMTIINELMTIVNQAKMNGLYREYLEISSIRLTQPSNEEPQPNKKEEVVTKRAKKEVKIPETIQPEISTPPISQPLISNQEHLDLLIKIMSIGDKDLRFKENDALSKIENYKNIIKYKRITRNLSQAQIGVSSEYYTVIVTANPETALILNSEENKQLVCELFNQLFDTHKQYLFSDKDLYEQAIERFKEAYTKQTLPLKEIVLQEFQTKILEESPQEEPSSEELIDQLFGDFVIKE